MKMTSSLAYEIKAEAFRSMTGHMAPGKDASIFSYPEPIEVRSDAWDKWRKENEAAYGRCSWQLKEFFLMKTRMTFVSIRRKIENANGD